ncbi:MAG: hypothetical protein QM657_15485 [Lacrimispora sp.]|uniref:hypothetical protein n=1 Tax=Lacrimispora sp. TaxID=2719234 RepID=UPI0039E473FD
MKAMNACYQIYKDIERMITEKTRNMSYDKTFRAKVIDQISADKYTILYKNKGYPASCGWKVKIGDVVWVCAPRNNWNELYIQAYQPDDIITAVNGVKGSDEVSYKSGYVNISPGNIGLGNVDNTSDNSKPVSQAQQEAINKKVSILGGDVSDTKIGTLENNIESDFPIPDNGDSLKVVVGKIKKFFDNILLYKKNTEDSIIEVNAKITDIKENIVLFYNTFSEIPHLKIKNNDIVQTGGYYTMSDSGGAIYKITDKPEDYSISLSNGLYANILNQDFVNYKMFGAIMDGLSDDNAYLRKAHFYCNKYRVLLKNNSGKIFKKDMEPIYIQSDVDLSGSVLYITNENSYSFYQIINDDGFNYYNYNIINKHNLKRGTSYFPMEDNSLPRHCVLKIEDKTVWSVRYDDGILTDTFRSELMFHNVYGNCMGPLIYGYDDYETQTNITYTKYNHRTLTFTGCEILIETTPNVTCNPITCKRHNTVLKSFFINPKHNSLNNVQYKNSVIRIDGCYNVIIKNIIGTNIAGKPNTNGSRGSGYSMRFDCSMGIRVIDCDIGGYWGATAMNNVKDIIFENCSLNRIDVHEYFRDLTINNCKIYDWGIQVGGGTGVLKITNTQFIKYREPNSGGQGIVNINNSYGALFDGNIMIDNIDIITEGMDMSLISVHFNSNSSTRATKRFPDVSASNISVDNVDLESTCKFVGIKTTGNVGYNKYQRGKKFVINHINTRGNFDGAVDLISRVCGTEEGSNLNAEGTCVFIDNDGFKTTMKNGNTNAVDFITSFQKTEVDEIIESLNNRIKALELANT